MIRASIKINMEVPNRPTAASQFQYKDNKLIFEDNETVWQCFKNILEELEAPRAGLRICAASVTLPNMASPKTKSLFSFLYSVYLVLRRKTTDADNVFLSLLACPLVEFWAKDWQEKEAIKHLLLRPFRTERRVVLVMPTRAGTGWVRPLPPELFVQPYMDSSFSSWDETFYLEWQWLRGLPQFDNDLDVYVWEPFREPPAFDYVRLMVLATDITRPIATTNSPLT